MTEAKPPYFTAAVRGAVTGVSIALSCAVAGAGEPVAALEARHERTIHDLSTLTREISLSQERATHISEEIAFIRDDAAAISASLVQAAMTERKLSQDVEDIAVRLDGLRMQEDGVRQSLDERRGLLAEVLGALQRIGLNPPPAVLVTPDDALASVRSSILLAAVVPEMRAETEILLGDLRELNRLTASIDAERRRLEETVAQQAEERGRLSLLLEERQRVQARSERALDEEQRRAEELAAEAGSMQELIDALEADLEIARREAEAAEQERLAALAEDDARAQEPPPQLRPSQPFASLQGQLGLPVAGRLLRRYGENDGAGGSAMGDMVATQSGAIVTAPSDGSVLYAGSFRSYGQLLILDAGDDYHVVLAGMGRISVAPGQRVLAGEPVGVMGEIRVASAVAFGNGSTAPELYVEFRKQGKPVDPAPWWAERASGRTEHDS